MGVVRGDRVAESRKLNTVSIEAQDFYQAVISTCPDDFGRFRLEHFSVAHALYKRRRPTMRMFSRVARLLEELTDAGLWQAWECDEVSFAEVTNWEARGNQYHRTPEPPFSNHTHNPTCIHTAMYQARQWTPELVPRLRDELRRFKAKQPAEFSQKRGSIESTYVSEGPAEGPLSSSPSVVRGDLRDRNTAIIVSDEGLGSYVAEILELYTSLPGTRDRPTRADREAAKALYRSGVPLAAVRAGLVIATARRQLRRRDEPLDPVGSLRYYRDAIEEARASQPGEGYVAHLRARIDQQHKPP